MPEARKSYSHVSSYRTGAGEAIARRGRLALGLTLASIVAVAWGCLYPHPYGLAMGVSAFLPLLAIFIVAKSSGRFRLYREPNYTCPSLAVPFALPPVVLALRAATDFYYLEWKTAVLLSFAIGIALLAVAAAADPFLRCRPANLIGLFLFTAAYGFGVTMETNCIVDRSPAVIYRSVIQKKHARGYGRSRSYYLQLAPWGPQRQSADIWVSLSRYVSAKKGDELCLAVRPGALKIPWSQD